MELKSPVSPPVSIAFGAILLLGAFFLGEKQFLLLQEGIHAEGTVTRIEERAMSPAGRQRGRKFYPVISFTDRDNKEITFTSEDGSARPDKFKPGDKFPVIYVKEDPAATAQADAGYELLAVPAVFGVFGLLFLLGGLPKGQREVL
ncbi:MAG: DUF3592 domain-containing protein [bacterium]|nr:DUF3592 domain-containing protein [bacterium]